jgi:cobalt-zinc-cadmium efflux system membrane fusion protein
LPTRGAAVDLAKGTIVLSDEARRALDMQTAEVRLRMIEERIVAPATLVAPWQRYAFATSRIEGRVTALHVQPGQAVRRGQALAEVESLELENWQLELLTARNEVKLAAENLAQFEAAGLRGAVAEQQLLEARTKQQENLSNLELARRKLLGLGIEAAFLDRLQKEPGTPPLRALPILSPIDGEVVHAEVQVGQGIQPTDHLIDVVDLSQVWVQIALLERDWPRVQVGQRVELRLAARPARVVRAIIEKKELALDPRTRQGIVWAKPTDGPAERELLPGMYGQATIAVPAGKAVRSVPTEAVIRDGVERYVLLEDSERLTRRNVVTGPALGGFTAITAGQLAPGDRVVTVGAHELAVLLPQGTLRPSKEAEANIGLKSEPVRKRAIADIVQLSGSVELLPGRKALVSARLPGAIQRIQVERSQSVAAGEVIAEVASTELQNLQLELLRQHLQVELLGETLERLRPLAEKSKLAVTDRKLRETESAYQAARQRRDSLERKLQAVGLTAEQVAAIRREKKLVDALPIRAPIGGSVVHFQAKLGQFVKAEDPLFEVHDLSRPVIRGYVAEAELPRVLRADRARVRLPADPSFLALGRVVRRGQVVGDTDRTLSVWVELPEAPAQVLLEGTLARLTLLVGNGRPVLAVRREAVVRSGGLTVVFVRQTDGGYAPRAVTVGAGDDEFVEIKGGLREGEVVAVHGAAELQTGYASLK